MDVSKNRGTPKSSILIGFSIINYPFWGGKNPLFLETPISCSRRVSEPGTVELFHQVPGLGPPWPEQVAAGTVGVAQQGSFRNGYPFWLL